MGAKMITRPFGRTGVDVPVFSTGGMRYQQDWKGPIPLELDQASQRNLESTIRHSLEVGCRHIETARGYGTSEYQLGLALKVVPRDDYILQSKVGPKEDPAEFKKELDLSFELLQADRLDLFAFHGINNTEILQQVIRPGGCLEVAKGYQDQGKIGALGFSTHGLCRDILKAIESDAFDYINVHWYFTDRSNDECLSAAQERNMGVFIISPSDKGGRLYDPPQKLVDLTAPLSPMVFNDLYCLHDPRVHTLSLGAAKASDFDEHLKTLPFLEDRQFDTMAEVRDRLEGALDAVAGADFRRSLSSLPTWDAVPRGVNLRVILRLWLLAKAFDMVEFGKMRYNLLGNGGHWFPGFKMEAEHQGELSAFLDKLPFGDILASALMESVDLFKGEEKKRLSES